MQRRTAFFADKIAVLATDETSNGEAYDVLRADVIEGIRRPSIAPDQVILARGLRGPGRPGAPPEKKEEDGGGGEEGEIYEGEGEGEGKIKATALAPPKALSGLGFRRAVRSARVPRGADCPMISTFFPAPWVSLWSFRLICASF